jgi:hypothetical protein
VAEAQGRTLAEASDRLTEQIEQGRGHRASDELRSIG